MLSEIFFIKLDSPSFSESSPQDPQYLDTGRWSPVDDDASMFEVSLWVASIHLLRQDVYVADEFSLGAGKI